MDEAKSLKPNGVSFQVSVKVILRRFRYDQEALRERQMIGYTWQEKGPMLC